MLVEVVTSKTESHQNMRAHLNNDQFFIAGAKIWTTLF